MGFWLKQIWSGGRPLVDHICKADIKFVAGCWPWLKKPGQFPGTLAEIFLDVVQSQVEHFVTFWYLMYIM
jgi:hypothetical protein